MKKIIVIKIGSSVLLTKRHKLDEFRITHLAEEIHTLQKTGFGVVLVISGAVAYGSNFVDLSENHQHLRQAAAGIGQIHVIATLNNIFNKWNLNLAQMLMTQNLFDSSLDKEKVKTLLEFYIHSNIIPVINENDVIDLNSFGGNDFLAAEIAKLLNTKKVVMLSTMKGSIHSVGGGLAKQQAIQMLARNNIETNIVNGKTKNILSTLML